MLICVECSGVLYKSVEIAAFAIDKAIINGLQNMYIKSNDKSDKVWQKTTV